MGTGTHLLTEEALKDGVRRGSSVVGDGLVDGGEGGGSSSLLHNRGRCGLVSASPLPRSCPRLLRRCPRHGQDEFAECHHEQLFFQIFTSKQINKYINK